MMKEIIVNKDESNQRADKYLMKYFSKASKGFIYKMLRKKRIKLNGKRIQGHEILQKNDGIQLFMAEETIEKFSLHAHVPTPNMPITFKVLYEDEHILVCHKPAGLLSQPDQGGERSLVDEITSYLIQKGDYDPNVTKGFRPGICNRLDRNTSGIVLSGKNLQALQALNGLIAHKKIDKHYQCIVSGFVSKKNSIEGYLNKDNQHNRVHVTKDQNLGHYIQTIYQPLTDNKAYSLLDVQIITGKSHQIRAHLSSIGHPLIGDYKYGKKNINDRFKKEYGLKHHLLHAYRIVFHVDSGILSYLDGKEMMDPVDDTFKAIANELFGTNRESKKRR
ncbi:RluA family pseudouridine synthase [Vallitalea pronyensis]|uniref:Pseudouridine synthase n=1 Tax=Vallitalea pronyensis TaxID=1348613 RepID=A0A8J8SHE4_9FIRM|nr:RluA family pseudouridine synthase [Vallitalea pronyensis]QUI23293.1 RluA family pseudouridine synthase [Vallitalea pronyensis]